MGRANRQLNTMPLKIALIGNPNSGKTSLFNLLTGLNQKVGNFPGVTVDRKQGQLNLPDGQKAIVIDLPGIYTLYANSQDEEITIQTLLQTNQPDYPDKVVLVIDATQPERSLALATQVIDLQIPLILALNMADILHNEGIKINTQLLSEQLNCPVVAISAREQTGITALKQAITEPIETKNYSKFFKIPPDLTSTLEAFAQQEQTSNLYQAFLKLLQSKLNKNSQPQLQINEVQAQYHQADDLHWRQHKARKLIDGVLGRKPTKDEQFTNKIDAILLHPVSGYLVFIVLLLLIFEAIFSWASLPMDLIDGGIAKFAGYLKAIMPEFWITDLLTDGLLMGLGGILVFVPQIAFLFFFLAILEESGYMARIVFLMDRIMRPFGFSGRAMVPLIGGMACAVPSIMMARNIPSTRERLLTIMVLPLMSCSARIPIYILLITMFVPSTRVLGFLTLQGLTMMGLYVLGFVAALGSALVFKMFLPQKSNAPLFLTEMPIYRRPRWRNVVLGIYNKCKTFVVEAGKIILLISLILWLLASYGPGQTMEEIDQKYEQQKALLESQTPRPEEEIHVLAQQHASERLKNSYAGRIGHFIEPAIAPLGYDWKIGICLLTSFAAREVFVGTMATIYGIESDIATEHPETLIEKMKRDTYPKSGKARLYARSRFFVVDFLRLCYAMYGTLAITRRETNSWKWTLIMLFYMTAMAYFAAWLVFRVMS